MRSGLIEAETFETLRMPQHLAPLLGQGGELSSELLLSCHTHLQHLFGFLPSGNAAEGRQSKRHAMRILRLTHPMALGHPEQLQINMDNGPESSGRRTQFLHRMVQLADAIHKPIQLVYYPPGN